MKNYCMYLGKWEERTCKSIDCSVTDYISDSVVVLLTLETVKSCVL